MSSAHPTFVAHFNHDIYTPDLPDNDERMPFGTDVGSDTFHHWEDRVGELRAHPTLDYMLHGGIDEWRASVDIDFEDADSDDDDHLISSGFVLLRSCGTLSADDAEIVLAALRRQSEDGSEYDIMLDDLTRFLQPRQDGDESSPSDSTTWITITSNAEASPGTQRWWHQLAKELATDPAWTKWWSSAPYASLRMYALPTSATGRDGVGFRRQGDRFEAFGASEAVSRRVWESTKLPPSSRPPFHRDSGLQDLTDDMPRLLRDQLEMMLRRVATELGLPPCPPLPN